jgi:hypothetical protein
LPAGNDLYWLPVVAVVRSKQERQVFMSTAQQQIYQQIQRLPLRERLQLIRQLFAEAAKTEGFTLVGSMTVEGDVDEIIKNHRADVMAKLKDKGERLRAELEG